MADSKRFVIIGASKIRDYNKIRNKLSKEDFIVAADGGQRHLKKLGVEADLYLGDYDSSEKPSANAETLVYPVEKDDTDTMLALKVGIKRGFKNFLILGGMGGRFDHTYANIQALNFAQRHHASAALADESNFTFILENDTAYIEKHNDEKVSVFALDGPAHGVTLCGFYYPLTNGTVYTFDPVGTSNYITGDKGKISVKKGKLLVIISEDV